MYMSEQRLAELFLKNQIVNILGFRSHVIFVATLLCHCTMKAITGNM